MVVPGSGVSHADGAGNRETRRLLELGGVVIARTQPKTQTVSGPRPTPQTIRSSALTWTIARARTMQAPGAWWLPVTPRTWRRACSSQGRAGNHPPELCGEPSRRQPQKLCVIATTTMMNMATATNATPTPPAVPPAIASSGMLMPRIAATIVRFSLITED